MCTLLLDAHADPNVASPDLITPLARSISHYVFDGWNCSPLVAAHADLEASDMLNRIALILAARRSHDEFVDMIVDAGASTTARDYLGRSALHYACGNERRHSELQTLRRLWSLQGVLSRDKRGCCALWYALHNPSLEAEWLVAMLEQALAEVEAESWPEVADRSVEGGTIPFPLRQGFVWALILPFLPFGIFSFSAL